MINCNGRQCNVLGICAAGIQQENVTELVQSIVRNTAALGIKVLLFSTFTDMYRKNAFADGEAGIFSLIDNDLLDAVAVLPESIKNDSVTDKIIERCRNRGLPVISVDKQIDNCVSVVFNYADSFEQIIRHVIREHKCRRINLVAGMKGNRFSEERVARFKKVLAENNIEFDERRLGYGDFWSGPTRTLAESWFKSGQELPEAGVCANDLMAIEVCRVFREHGLKVPDDVIVTGFDGILDINFSNPRITSSLCCYGDITRKIAGLLSLGREELLHEAHYAIKSRLIISESCADHNCHTSRK